MVIDAMAILCEWNAQRLTRALGHDSLGIRVQFGDTHAEWNRRSYWSLKVYARAADGSDANALQPTGVVHLTRGRWVSDRDTTGSEGDGSR